MPTPRLHPEAEADYLRAYAWYKERSERAADRFEEEAVESAFEAIADSPDQWPLLDRRHHFYLVKRFPYHIVYRTAEGDVEVLAVAHGRRRSRYWRGRK